MRVSVSPRAGIRKESGSHKIVARVIAGPVVSGSSGKCLRTEYSIMASSAATMNAGAGGEDEQADGFEASRLPCPAGAVEIVDEGRSVV